MADFNPFFDYFDAGGIVEIGSSPLQNNDISELSENASESFLAFDNLEKATFSTDLQIPLQEPCPVALSSPLTIGGGDEVKAYPVAVTPAPTYVRPVALAPRRPIPKERPKPILPIFDKKRAPQRNPKPKDEPSAEPRRRPYHGPEVKHLCNCFMAMLPEELWNLVREGTADELHKGDIFLVSHRKKEKSLEESEASWRVAIFVAKIKSGNIRYRLLPMPEFSDHNLHPILLAFSGSNVKKKTYKHHYTHLIRCIGGDQPHFFLLKKPVERPQGI